MYMYILYLQSRCGINILECCFEGLYIAYSIKSDRTPITVITTVE